MNEQRLQFTITACLVLIAGYLVSSNPSRSIAKNAGYAGHLGNSLGNCVCTAVARREPSSKEEAIRIAVREACPDSKAKTLAILEELYKLPATSEPKQHFYHSFYSKMDTLCPEYFSLP